VVYGSRFTGEHPEMLFLWRDGFGARWTLLKYRFIN
jgi:hypothetical protein